MNGNCVCVCLVSLEAKKVLTSLDPELQIVVSHM